MEKMIHGFSIILNSKDEWWKSYKTDLIVYTGKIDEYFDYCYGKLPYRTLNFIHTNSKNKLPAVTINQNTKEKSYTRIYDHSYFNYKHQGQTIITEEYPKECKDGDIPFYPMPFGEGLQIYAKYKELADKEENVIFLGRLATYTYLDMWMAVKQAMLKIKIIE
jgi:UDP-galactopyranose mutase